MTFPIVGIGASAGGLEALEAMTKRLTAGGMAFIVLQHLAPGHESILTDILARDTALTVTTVADGMPVEIDHIYVTPPNAELAIHQRVLYLMPPEATRRGPRPSIDAFFRTLAADLGNLAVGVILSGAGSDGTLGLKAIKEADGVTFAQDPSTANQPSMPQSALDAGVADFALRAQEIGDELMRLSQHPYVGARPQKLFDEDARSKLFILLRSAFGVDFAAYKPTTIDRRILRRLMLHKLDRLEDYLSYVQTNAAELNVLYSDLLIGVTAFFRDKEPFEVLKAVAFPALLDSRRPDVPLRIWVAGCATGEEAYSIAMCLIEHLGDRAPGCKIQIFATDIDDAALAHARQAAYPQSIELDVSPQRLQRFFSRSDDGYQINRALRDMVVFARHNLGKDPPFSRIDLVCCRNVLIYMQPALQKKVLRVLHYALNPDAFLLLGTSESVGEASDLFSLVDRKNKLYTKKNVVATVAFDVAVGARPDAEPAKLRPAEHRPAISLLQLADRKVLEQYGPPGVVVNDAFEIVQYRGKTGRFFEPTPGAATTNLMKLIRPELVHELRTVLPKAQQEAVRVVSDPVHFGQGANACVVRLDVTPLPDPGAAGKTLLVLFAEHGEAPPEAPPAVEVSLADARVEALDRELVATKEYLQTTIEELEAANEELQSSNEELQSTNEELETSKEELQSTNEELVTLNEELQSRMDQLNVTNDDLQNILSASSSAVVLVGTDLRIRRFSRAAEELLNLIPGDVGRPITYIRTGIRVRDIEQTVGEAIKTMSPRAQRVRGIDGSWYSMGITPYRTADSVIRGAVLELVRGTGETMEPRAPHGVHGLGGAILAAVPHPLAVLDQKLCVIWANQAFLVLFHVQADIFGRPLEDLWNGKADQPEVWQLLESAVHAGRSFQRVLANAPFGDPLNTAKRISAGRLSRGTDDAALTLVMIEDEGKAGVA
ncbi:MAG TPA: CheR family methyltransferase [Kofleriaceae bacterium]